MAKGWVKAAIAACAVALAGAAAAEDIQIPIDMTAPMRLSQPAEGVSVGNASIVGVSVQDPNLIFLTGRAYGTTNIVVVGAGGRTLYNGRVTVTPSEAGVVTVQRGLEAANLTCSPVCRPRPDIGDGSTSFQAANEQITGRASTAQASGR